MSHHKTGAVRERLTFERRYGWRRFVPRTRRGKVAALVVAFVIVSAGIATAAFLVNSAEAELSVTTNDGGLVEFQDDSGNNSPGAITTFPTGTLVCTADITGGVLSVTVTGAVPGEQCAIGLRVANPSSVAVSGVAIQANDPDFAVGTGDGSSGAAIEFEFTTAPLPASFAAGANVSTNLFVRVTNNALPNTAYGTAGVEFEIVGT